MVSCVLLSVSVLVSSDTRRRFPYFFFYPPPTTEIYTLSLHDALPISPAFRPRCATPVRGRPCSMRWCARTTRSEEHTSELQSHSDLVCRLLLEKKKS